MTTPTPADRRPYRQMYAAGPEIVVTTDTDRLVLRQVGWLGQTGAFYALDEDPLGTAERGGVAPLYFPAHGDRLADLTPDDDQHPMATPAVWSDGDPLMTAIAAAVSEQCATHPEQGLTVDDPRSIAAVAATVARQVLGTPTTDTAPCVHPEGYEGECPCPPSCPCCDVTAAVLPASAPAAPVLEPQDHPGADLFVALQAAGLDADEANRRMYAYAAMVLRQEQATAADPAAPADRAADEAAKQALSVAGAFCGDCGFEPGDRGCPDCERTWTWYVDSLRAAGWGPSRLVDEAQPTGCTSASCPAPGDCRHGCRAAADELSRETEDDDTLHTCPGRWGGPDCRCFDPEPATAATEEPQP